MKRGVGWFRRMAAEVGETAAAAVATLVPPLCVVCDRRLGPGERWLCARCDREVSAGVGLRTKRIGLAGRGCLVARYGLEYRPDVARVIVEMKYGGKPGLAEYLARLVWGATGGGVGPRAVFVPVPMHPSRRRERGYNQAEELSKHLARLARAAFDGRALRKQSNTDCQAALAREARLTNVVDSIGVGDVRGLEGRSVILVDDVVTTGSTFRACALALADHGIGDVSAWAVASSA
jgi:ComF family protein